METPPDAPDELGQLNIKGIPKRELERYRETAARHQRSVQSWARMVLSAAARDDKGLILRLTGGET